MRTNAFRCLVYIAISVACACGQTSPSGSEPLAEISYRPVGNLIYIPTQVNGSKPLWFCFDFGAPNSIIDQAAAQTLKVKALTPGIIHGAGRGDIPAGDAGEVRLTVGGLTTLVQHARIVDLSKVPGVKQDGLLGAEFFEQYVVRIDPVQHKIAFYAPGTFVYHGDGKSLPLELTNSRLYIQAGLAAVAGHLVDRRLRVDTGSEDSIDDDTVRKLT